MSDKIAKFPYFSEAERILPLGFLPTNYRKYRNVVSSLKTLDIKYVEDDIGKEYMKELYNAPMLKMYMFDYVTKFLENEGIVFDKFNGLPPTCANLYKAYEFSALFLWSIMCAIVDNKTRVDFLVEKENFYEKFGDVISSVFNKYPKITGFLITLVDMKMPGNKFLDFAKMDEVDFDADHTDDGDDEKAKQFKDWLMSWYGKANDHDKMRVRRWFETGKSHKQILSEIRRVVGNTHKFNSRLSAFIERLLNHDDLENFMSKSGYPNKEEMFMAYFETIKDFDEDTKRSFIKKYLV